jgi:hypothetical protein
VVTFVQSAVRIAIMLLVPGAASAQDISELAGVVPGRVMEEVEASASDVRSPMPFVFFGAPTTLPALAKIFPSAELYVLKNGTVVGARWKRAYRSKPECAAAEAVVNSLLKPYLPSEVSGKDRWRYQIQTTDKQIGAGVSCKENHGNFQELMLELVHFKLDGELSALIGGGR